MTTITPRTECTVDDHANDAPLIAELRIADGLAAAALHMATVHPSSRSHLRALLREIERAARSALDALDEEDLS